MTELQEKMLSLIKEIDDICRREDIDYSLHGGSLIGAVRHKGFVPWDDDLDIMFTRSNWDRFREAVRLNRPDRVLCCVENGNKYCNIWAKYIDPSSTYVFPSGICGEETIGCFIDIGILDKISERDFESKKAEKMMVDYGEFINNDHYVTNRRISSSARNFFWRNLSKLIGKEKVRDIFLKRIRSGENCVEKKYMQNSPVYPVAWDEKYFNQKPVYVPFEDTELPIVQNAESFLRYTYGDEWYIFPDTDGRTGHIGVHYVQLNGKVFERTFRPYINTKNVLKNRRIYKRYRLKAVVHEDIVRTSNTKRMAVALAYDIDNKLKNCGVDLNKLLSDNEYARLLSIFDPYLFHQFHKRFRQDGIAIRICDDLLAIICMTLILTGKYYQARKILVWNYGEDEQALPKMFSEANDLINASKALSIAMYDEKDWDAVKELVETWLARYPHHHDIVCASFILRLIKIKKDKELKTLKKDICRELEIHKDSDLLLTLMAEVHSRQGEETKAQEFYRHAYAVSKNGILRQALENIAKERAFEIESSEEAQEDFENNIDSENKEEEKLGKADEDDVTIDQESSHVFLGCDTNRIQQHIFTLLKEFDDACRLDDIPYFLGGYLAAEAVELGTFLPGCWSAYVIVHPRDRKRLIKALEKNMPPMRAVESIESNKDYPDFSIRYTHTGSLFYKAEEFGFYRHNGIALTVYFARPIEKKIRRKINSGIYAAVEAIAYPSIYANQTRKKIIAGVLGRVASMLLTKKGFKKIAWQIIYRSHYSKNLESFTIKSYWYKRIPLPPVDFSKKELCMLNDHAFPIPVNYYAFNRPQIRKNWKEINFTPKAPNYVFADISCDDYIRKIDSLHLKKRYSKAAGKLSRINAKAAPASRYLLLAWKIVCRELDRIKLAHTYLPLKDDIMALWNSGDYDALGLVLQDYIDAINNYVKSGLAIAFDNDILRAAWAYMDHIGRGRMIETMLYKMPRSHYSPANIKRLMKSIEKDKYTMYQADNEDRKKILDYISEDLPNCLYMYADIGKYSLEEPPMKVWYDVDSQGIRMVVMKYHTNFQLYCDRDFDKLDGVLQLIEQEKPYGIAGRKEIISALAERTADTYSVEYGCIFKNKEKVKTSEQSNLPFSMEIATEEDVPAIAELLFLDEEFRTVYTMDSMQNELYERIQSGMGRSFIARNKGKIVAHVATYAETDRFVVISGLMVHPDYRDTEVGYVAYDWPARIVREEGKDSYCFALKPQVIRLHKHASVHVADYGKMALKEIDE